MPDEIVIEEKPPDETKPPEQKPEEKPPEPEVNPVAEVVKVEIEEQSPPTFATWAEDEKVKLYERLEEIDKRTKPQEKTQDESGDDSVTPEPESKPAATRRKGLRVKSNKRK